MYWSFTWLKAFADPEHKAVPTVNRPKLTKPKGSGATAYPAIAERTTRPDNRAFDSCK